MTDEEIKDSITYEQIREYVLDNDLNIEDEDLFNPLTGYHSTQRHIHSIDEWMDAHADDVKEKYFKEIWNLSK